MYLVYVHWVNNLPYVGKCKINLKRGIVYSLFYRWNIHCYDALKYNSNYYFHNAIRLYGKDNVKHGIIEDNIPDDQICEREKHWIKILKSKIPNGYNMTDGGEGTPGRECKQSTKDKIGKANKGKKRSLEDKQHLSKVMSGEGNPFWNKKHTKESLHLMSIWQIGREIPSLHKAVKQMDKITKETIMIYKSLTEASHTTKINCSNIVACCKGKLKSAGGYIWEYVI